MLEIVPLEFYLLLSAGLFAIGLIGVLLRRNIIIVFMCIELMLNSVNLTLIAFAQASDTPTGQIIVLFVMALAAAEAAIGLALIIAFFRLKKSLDLNDLNVLKW